MDLIGKCMQCERGLRIGDTTWTLNVHHEKSMKGLLPDGSHGVRIQVIDSWVILCLCENCMKKHLGR